MSKPYYKMNIREKRDVDLEDAEYKLKELLSKNEDDRPIGYEQKVALLQYQIGLYKREIEHYDNEVKEGKKHPTTHRWTKDTQGEIPK